MQIQERDHGDLIIPIHLIETLRQCKNFYVTVTKLMVMSKINY